MRKNKGRPGTSAGFAAGKSGEDFGDPARRGQRAYVAGIEAGIEFGKVDEAHALLLGKPAGGAEKTDAKPAAKPAAAASKSAEPQAATKQAAAPKPQAQPSATVEAKPTAARSACWVTSRTIRPPR